MQFLIAISTLPTLVFSVLLAIACVYWLFVIIGAAYVFGLGGKSHGHLLDSPV
jgi:hypothetical protein